MSDSTTRRSAAEDAMSLGTAATYTSYQQFKDPMIRAAAAEARGLGADTLRWLGYADQELARLRELLDLKVNGYATGRPEYVPQERVTHGRHCLCGSCVREDWTNPQLAPCGMHGSSCPAEYRPFGSPGQLIDAAEGAPQ